MSMMNMKRKSTIGDPYYHDITNEVRSLLQELVMEVDRCRIERQLPTRTANGRQPSFSIAKVVAPMVGQSDLPFRLLCRRYGATACYTEMLYSEKIIQSEAYRCQMLESCKKDHPLIVQLCGSCPEALAAAAQLVAAGGRAAAVDLNLGCPQRRALEGGYGSALLDKKHWPKVFSMIHAMCSNLAIPVFCKIRLCEGGSKKGGLPQSVAAATADFARGLEAAGCACLAVHGRQRGSARRRRCGPADLDAIREIREAINIPVISNGNIQTPADISKCLKTTGADGVMSAEGILKNPLLFFEPTIQSHHTDFTDQNNYFKENTLFIDEPPTDSSIISGSCSPDEEKKRNLPKMQEDPKIGARTDHQQREKAGLWLEDNRLARGNIGTSSSSRGSKNSKSKTHMGEPKSAPISSRKKSVASILGEYLDLCEQVLHWRGGEGPSPRNLAGELHPGGNPGQQGLDAGCIRQHFHWVLGKTGRGSAVRYRRLPVVAGHHVVGGGDKEGKGDEAREEEMGQGDGRPEGGRGVPSQRGWYYYSRHTDLHVDLEGAQTVEDFRRVLSKIEGLENCYFFSQDDSIYHSNIL